MTERYVCLRVLLPEVAVGYLQLSNLHGAIYMLR